MTNEVSQKLVQYLGTLEGAVKTSSDFVVEQAPLVLQELLLRERIVTGVVVFISLGLALLAVLFGIAGSNYEKKNPSDDGDFPYVVGFLVCAFISAFISIVTAIANFYPFITCWFMPRVFILEQIKYYL